jgi:hypothetical protein
VESGPIVGGELGLKAMNDYYDLLICFCDTAAGLLTHFDAACHAGITLHLLPSALDEVHQVGETFLKSSYLCRRMLEV